MTDIRSLAASLLPRSHVPYSGQPEAVVLVLTDGSWIPGVRVESASFSVTIPAIQNAVTTAVALGRTDIVAIGFTNDVQPADLAYLGGVSFLSLAQADSRLLTGDLLPDIVRPVDPLIGLPGGVNDPWTRIGALLDRAFVTESDYPVACAVGFDEGTFIPGVNVEHPDWRHILCAERNAMGTAISYGLGTPRSLHLMCRHDDNCSPCGACRQLLCEWSPDLQIVMHRGEKEPEITRISNLLPGFFSGDAIVRG